MKELSLICPSSAFSEGCGNLTDVGIRYGFNFKELRRLEISVGEEVKLKE